MRTCTLCKLELPVTAFGNHKNGRDGLRSRCKPCNRIEARESYRKNPEPYKRRAVSAGKTLGESMRVWLRGIKQDTQCVACGESDICVLDFHHVISGEKDRAIGSCIRKGIAFVEAELEKCVVLCANCHRKAHAGKIDVTTKPRCSSKFERSPNRRK